MVKKMDKRVVYEVLEVVGEIPRGKVQDLLGKF